ncbi:TAXI family TRAP transporter solute-binding subunit [Desulforhopalus sp. IMCC35007]|uniref:TAXI family TRAP transporter solute-binding subunit n=1 Tax=Desulforhopalus sp. IMCC35007 TaxID=2569543 RepID=UPI0010ADD42A|nr:TAXI family TRAP transporter solute-binding subunit [Desulforhopalus sp. IMCC35007]TKB05817.1 TAXI family TRAP transporter solute-binding subunit [Desulforhopalus sp. IMCC35007]
MKFTTHLKHIAAVTTLCIGLFAGTHLQAAESKSFLLATASTGGTYYPVGVAISTLIKVKLQPTMQIGMSAINSAGSGENIKLLRENEAQFAILQGLYGYYAWNGKGPLAQDGPQTELRSVSMLWQNVEHFTILSSKAKTGTISDMVDLKGERVSLGKKNSGTIGSNTVILSNLGADIEKDYDLIYVGYGPSADALQNGQIAGMGTPAGVPASAVTRALASMGDKATLLGFTAEQAEKADGGLGLWTPYEIPADAYPGMTKAITTIAQPNFLAVRSDIDDETVYQITKTLYENLPFLNAIHKATKAMSAEKALAGLPIPLHPGALRYFQEIGMTIPEKLIAK